MVKLDYYTNHLTFFVKSIIYIFELGSSRIKIRNEEFDPGSE